MRRPIFLLLAAGIATGIASAQSGASPTTELLLFTQHSGFTDPQRSAHRTLTVQYYHALNPGLKLFGDLTLSRRFDEADRSAGLGAYLHPGENDWLYGFVAVGFSPSVIPRLDATLEYTRLLADRLTASLGYRIASFSAETVHMFVPAVTLYVIPRWTITPRVFLARLSSDATVRATFLLHLTFDLSESVMPELYYAVGSESYRTGALEYFAGRHSWDITLGTKVQLSEHLRLRVHVQHEVRIGAFEENAVDAALSLLW
jgi:YaiO family outer membrane protein